MSRSQTNGMTTTGRWSRSAASTLCLSLCDTRRRLSSIYAPPPSVAATAHRQQRHALSCLSVPPQSAMASDPALAAHCNNCGAHVSHPPKDCIDKIYDFSFYDPPRSLLKLALVQTLLGLVILGLGSGCSIHGIISSNNDGVINCIDFSGCWMGICHCALGFISTCILMSRPRNKHSALKFVTVAALLSAVFDCVLVLIMTIWTVVFFVKDRYDFFAIDIALLTAALLHGCLSALTLMTIIKTAPKRAGVGGTATVSPLPPLYQTLGPMFVEPPPSYEMAVAQKNAQQHQHQQQHILPS